MTPNSPHEEAFDPVTESIDRAKSARPRTELSRPIQLVLDFGLLHPGRSIFDYGCGRGDDVRNLTAMGFEANGWDPSFRPNNQKRASQVVNLGYVVNVIENIDERNQVLQDAFDLAEELLVVSARPSFESKALGDPANFRDGVVTQRGTFQKFFEQDELRSWIAMTLGASPVAIGPGIFLVFRCEELKHEFLASGQRNRLRSRAPRDWQLLLEKHTEEISPLIDFLNDRGRIPHNDEIPTTRQLTEIFGSVKRAFAAVVKTTGTDSWDEVALERKNDLQVYFALTRFGDRPRMSDLSKAMQRDIKALWGSYAKLTSRADELLFKAGNMDVIKEMCKKSNVGKKLPDSLYVHESALSYLDPILRVYEGCARCYVGVVDGANLIKLNIKKPQVSYLCYPEFENDSHPSLVGSLTVPLQTRKLSYRDYSSSENPPILHRKETFIHDSHPQFDEFAELTREEEKIGLLQDARKIGFLNGWNLRLQELGVSIKNHQVTSTNASSENS